MSFYSNTGSTYYSIPCGVLSDAGVNVSSNIFSGYYYKQPNEYILWGQNTLYSHINSNIGSNTYFLKCNTTSDSNINLQSNSGTKFFYSSSFNCVSFCS